MKYALLLLIIVASSLSAARDAVSTDFIASDNHLSDSLCYVTQRGGTVRTRTCVWSESADVVVTDTRFLRDTSRILTHLRFDSLGTCGRAYPPGSGMLEASRGSESRSAG